MQTAGCAFIDAFSRPLAQSHGSSRLLRVEVHVLFHGAETRRIGRILMNGEGLHQNTLPRPVVSRALDPPRPAPSRHRSKPVYPCYEPFLRLRAPPSFTTSDQFRAPRLGHRPVNFSMIVRQSRPLVALRWVALISSTVLVVDSATTAEVTSFSPLRGGPRDA